jgi:outer membrane protein assembly factor BamB
MRISRLSLKSLVLAAASLSASISLKADWPQWRGPNRDGMVKDAVIPATWPKALKEEWKTPVGLGHASPVESNGKIFVFTRQAEDEVLLCLDAVTGKEVWRSSQPVSYEMNEARTDMAKAQSQHRSLVTASSTPSAFPACYQLMMRNPAS